MSHPSAKNIRAKDLMTTKVHTLSASDSIGYAVDWMLAKGHSGAPVVDEHRKLLGVLSEYDCLEALRRTVTEWTPEDRVSSYMTKEVATVSPETPVYDLCARFSEMCWRRVVVVDDQQRVVGLVSRRDLMKALRDEVYRKPGSNTYDLIEKQRLSC